MGTNTNDYDSDYLDYCPCCDTKLLPTMTGKGWFMCDNCGAEGEKEVSDTEDSTSSTP